MALVVLGAEERADGHTRMVSAAESPVHDNYKNLVVDTTDTGTVFLNRFHKPGFRVLATPYSEREDPRAGCRWPGSMACSLYFDGNLDASFAFGGQVAGRIDEVMRARDHPRDDRRVPRDAAKLASSLPRLTTHYFGRRLRSRPLWRGATDTRGHCCGPRSGCSPDGIHQVR
jgi:hypothetical protein